MRHSVIIYTPQVKGKGYQHGPLPAYIYISSFNYLMFSLHSPYFYDSPDLSVGFYYTIDRGWGHFDTKSNFASWYEIFVEEMHCIWISIEYPMSSMSFMYLRAQIWPHTCLGIVRKIRPIYKNFYGHNWRKWQNLSLPNSYNILHKAGVRVYIWFFTILIFEFTSIFSLEILINWSYFTDSPLHRHQHRQHQ